MMRQKTVVRNVVFFVLSPFDIFRLPNLKKENTPRPVTSFSSSGLVDRRWRRVTNTVLGYIRETRSSGQGGACFDESNRFYSRNISKPRTGYSLRARVIYTTRNERRNAKRRSSESHVYIPSIRKGFGCEIKSRNARACNDDIGRAGYNDT